jgi:hypothetical protein
MYTLPPEAKGSGNSPRHAGMVTQLEQRSFTYAAERERKSHGYSTNDVCNSEKIVQNDIKHQ